MKKNYFKLVLLLFAGMVSFLSSNAQDLTIAQPNDLAGWNTSGGNIVTATGGSTAPTVQNGTAVCLTGYTLRLGSNTSYLEISSASNSTISKISFDVTGNSTSDATYIAVIAYSSDAGTTWSSAATSLTFTFDNNYNHTCTNYSNSSLPAGVNKIRIWRKYTDSNSASVGDGKTIRLGNLNVWSASISTGVSSQNIKGVSFDGKTINNAQQVNLSVFDLSGRFLLSSNQNIDMSGKSKGVYIVKSENGVMKININ